MKSKISIILSWLIFIIISIGMALSILVIAQKPLPPLIYAKIPQETIDFIRGLMQDGSDLLGRINRNPNIDDWDNYKNFGEDSATGLKKMEDENFIIYFRNNRREYEKAKEVKTFAKEAIKPLENLMGKYYYPKDVNNRKLAIYIGETYNDYIDIVRKVSEDENANPQGSAGIYIFDISEFGVLTRGIVLSPVPWKENKNIYPKKVLWHEMNHYIYFSSIDFKKNPYPFLWLFEGTAEYFVDFTDRYKEINLEHAKNIHFTKEIKNFYDNYWAGYTVFKYMEKDFKKKTVKEFIGRTYSNSILNTFNKSINIPVPKFENNWREYIKDVKENLASNR